MALSNATSSVGYHRPVFVKWVRESPQDCSDLLQGLRIAAYGHPDAAQLVQELEHLLAWTGEPSSPPRSRRARHASLLTPASLTRRRDG